jgi:16S rRNA G966 N2-methylase RsmD
MDNTLTTQDRIEFYNITLGKKYPDSKLFIGEKGNFVKGIWMIGNCYKNASKLYGAYPYSYLERITKLFPDCNQILHLFSGSLTEVNNPHVPENAVFFDINPKYKTSGAIIGDAHKLSNYFLPNTFDIIFVDPPYSNEDSVKYGTPMVNRNTVLKECIKVLKPNGFIVWLDQVYPMYRKDTLKLIGTIGLIRSTNHRFRCVIIYQKV